MMSLLEDADEPQQRVGVGGRDPHLPADLGHRGQQGVDLEGPARLRVLQHGRPERAELARDGIAVLAALADRTPDPLPDRRGLRHDGQRVPVEQRVVQDAVAGRPGQRRNGIHRHVSPELVPDVGLDARGNGRLESGRSKQLRQRGHPGRDLAPRLSNNQLVAEAVTDETGLHHRAGRVHHAADDVATGYRDLDAAVRVDRREPHAVTGAAGRRQEEPPRHAVHRGQHHGVRSQQGRDLLSGAAERRPLDGQDHQVLRAERGAVFDDPDRRRGEPSCLLQPESVSPERRRCRAAGQRAELAGAAREMGADERADGPGTDDADLHDAFARYFHHALARYLAPVVARMLPRCSCTWLTRMASIACAAVMAGMPTSTLALLSSSASLRPRTIPLALPPFALRSTSVSALVTLACSLACWALPAWIMSIVRLGSGWPLATSCTSPEMPSCDTAT